MQTTLTPLALRIADWAHNYSDWTRGLEEWARARRERVLPEYPPSRLAVAIARVPESAWWLAALAGLVAAFTAATNGPWG